jgi:hypothetical protein
MGITTSRKCKCSNYKTIAKYITTIDYKYNSIDNSCKCGYVEKWINNLKNRTQIPLNECMCDKEIMDRYSKYNEEQQRNAINKMEKSPLCIYLKKYYHTTNYSDRCIVYIACDTCIQGQDHELFKYFQDGLKRVVLL